MFKKKLFSLIIVYSMCNFSADPADVARAQLRLPDVKAQRKAGISKLAPIRSFKDPTKEFQEKMNQLITHFFSDKTRVSFNHGVLHSNFFNNSTILKEIEKFLKKSDSDIKNKLSFKNFVVDRAYLQKLKEQLVANSSDQIIDGEYVYTIDENLELRVILIRENELQMTEMSNFKQEEINQQNLYKRLLFLPLRSYLEEKFATSPAYLDFHGFLGGKNVLCAGVMVIRDGKIISMSDASGHYKPYPWHLYYAIDALMKKEGKQYFADDFNVEWLSNNRDRLIRMSWSNFKQEKPWNERLEELNRKSLDLVFKMGQPKLTFEDEQAIDKQVLSKLGFKLKPSFFNNFNLQEINVIKLYKMYDIEYAKKYAELSNNTARKCLNIDKKLLEQEAHNATCQDLLKIANSESSLENAYLTFFRNLLAENKLPLRPSQVRMAEYDELQRKIDAYEHEYNILKNSILNKRIQKRIKNIEKYRTKINPSLPVDQQMEQLRGIVRVKLENMR